MRTRGMRWELSLKTEWIIPIIDVTTTKDDSAKSCDKLANFEATSTLSTRNPRLETAEREFKLLYLEN